MIRQEGSQNEIFIMNEEYFLIDSADANSVKDNF